MSRFLFLVQGEGRGHLTQAVALAQLLRSAGHGVCAVLVGTPDGRPAPAFFAEAIQTPVETFCSPGLAYDPQTHALDLTRTAWRTIRNGRAFLASLRRIRRAIDHHRPDVVVNFYDVLAGLTYALYRPAPPLVCVGHQYLLLHPDFPHPQGFWLDRLLVNLNTRLTALGAFRRLALSFTPLEDQPGLRVVPPLLRQDVLTRKPGAAAPGTMTFLLAYVSQDALSQQLLDEHARHPQLPIRLFKGGLARAVEPVDDTLTLYRIDGTAFLDQMQVCTAVVTTAGFESVCEAMYLGKPVLLMPMPNHYEQRCNAIDAVRAGAGVADFHRFDLQRLIDYLPTHPAQANQQFRSWQHRCAALFLETLETAATPAPAPSRRFFFRRWPAGFGPETAPR